MAKDQDEEVVMYDEDIIKRNRRNTWIFVIAVVIVVLAAIVSALLINKYVITSYEIDGSSMYPTLIGASYDEEGNKVIGDYVYLNKSKKKFDRGDIIVFIAHEDDQGNQTKYVKRIIGVAGDTVEIKDNILYVNGERKDESYINEPMITLDITVTVQDGCYFVMGDNRNHSSDSRTEWADNNHCVPGSRIIGKAFLIKHASGKLQWIKK